MASTCNIFEKIRGRIDRMKSNLRQTGIEEINAIVDFINSIGYYFGTEFTQDWFLSKRSVFSAFVLAMIWWDVYYTFYMAFPSIECILLIGGYVFSVTTFTKFVVIVSNQKKFVSLLMFIFKVFNENVNKGTRESILIETTATIRRHCKYVLVGVVFGLGVYSCYPTYDFLVNGNLTLVSPLKLPFVDEKTLGGYLILTAFNVWIAAWGCVIMYSFSCLFLVFVDVYGGMISLLEDDLEEFDSMWENKDDQLIIERRKATFRNIMMQLMDLARYNKFMNELFSVVATVQIGCCYIGIVICVFGFLAANYLGGMGGGAYFSLELMMFSYIGQLLANSCERVAMVVYNCKWYTYGTKYQKDLKFALAIIQRSSPIRVAYIFPLNFMTGLRVVNNIYSVLMMMLNFLD